MLLTPPLRKCTKCSRALFIDQVHLIVGDNRFSRAPNPISSHFNLIYHISNDEAIEIHFAMIKGKPLTNRKELPFLSEQTNERRKITPNF